MIFTDENGKKYHDWNGAWPDGSLVIVEASDPSGGTPDGAKRPLATPATPVDNNLREQIKYEIETLQTISSQQAVKEGAMSWQEIVEYKTSKILALITHSNNAAREEVLHTVGDVLSWHVAQGNIDMIHRNLEQIMETLRLFNHDAATEGRSEEKKL